MSDYSLTLFEACEYLNRSKKTISRYIRQGLLHPQAIKSQQGTLEYRFSREDLEAYKTQETQGQAWQAEEQPKKARVKTIKEDKRQDRTGRHYKAIKGNDGAFKKTVS